ncbi:MAG: PrsW family intramembrane metalloprotease [Propionibacteriaceae bacterium]|jgi:RsiW-degrading membrane proteinase PrsW (M82 family)|nr:PrsW family intramembrane metalloprotease [Propionibacteriaceae bacterium]
MSMTAVSEQITKYQRTVAGLPEPVNLNESWLRRRIRNPFTWATLALLLVAIACFALFYFEMRTALMEQVASVSAELSQPQELTKNQYYEAFWMGARLALPTLLVYVAIFFLIDRLRPTPIAMKLVALAWGAGISVLVSLQLNTWMGTLVGVQGAGDPGTGDRSAIFVAPFVEEMSKSTIVLLLAIMLRYRLVTPLQTIPLAGLSAVGFAFTENILYYSRIWIYGSKITGQNPVETLASNVFARGVLLSWGHPLFTSCVAIGVIIGIRQQSKLARILVPLTGFCLAATGHMTFNGIATVVGDVMSMVFLGVMLILTFGSWLWRQFAKERLRLAWRLDDYVRAGYLTERDPLVFCLLKNRCKLLLAAALRGWRCWSATSHFISDLSELAYLRAAITQGLVADASRERELINSIEANRLLALTEVNGLKIKPETWTINNIKFKILSRLAWTRYRNAPPNSSDYPIPVGRYPAQVSASQLPETSSYPPPYTISYPTPTSNAYPAATPKRQLIRRKNPFATGSDHTSTRR